jgi:polyhydroxyalkanoate synthesis regulator phasin
MLDDLRNYLQLASGLTEATTAKAKEVATGLLSTGLSMSSKATPPPEMMGQVQELADDLLATSKNNRDMLTAMIRAEVDKAVGRMGFVREDELAALRRHVQRLEHELADLQRESANRAATPVVVTSTPDEADAIADAAISAEQPAAEMSESDVAAEPDAAAAPVDVVGEAVEAPKKKKKKILVDPDA